MKTTRNCIRRNLKTLAACAAAVLSRPEGIGADGDSARLINIATRAQIGGNAGTPIAGFVISGQDAKRVLVRACGPALAGFSVPGSLADPSLSLLSSSATLASNDNWLAADTATMTAAGAFALAPGSRDAALVATLPAGSYTAPVTAPGTTSGVALLEIYDASTSTTSSIVNASTRAFVGTGTSVLIPGFVISGTGSLRLLIRAVGPSLNGFGVPDTLADPTVTLYRDATALATNDNWSNASNAAEISAAATSVGAFALSAGSKDAAILTSLTGGSYTAVVSGVGNTTGTALVELYTVSGTLPATTTSFAPKFVRIPGGSFSMGDHVGFVDPDHPSDEIPLHNVTVSSFYMCTTLITCREYCDYLNASLKQGAIEVRAGSVYAVGGKEVFFDTSSADQYSTIQYANGAFAIRTGRDLHPATGVRWFGAIAYCNWLSARDGYAACYTLSTGACDLTKNGYRLPTEAEWEYAARGGQYTPYRQFPWGDDTNPDGRLSNWEGSGDPWEAGDMPRTTPVGFYNGSLQQKSDHNWPASSATYQTRNGSNAYGLYDMAGNVWQWINDWYASDYYSTCVTNKIVDDPPGPATGTIFSDHGGIAYRGLRGGTWYNGGGQQFLGFSRVSNRDPAWSLGPAPAGAPPGGAAWFNVGFRVMRPDKASTTTRTVGLFLNTSAAAPGYTLMSPIHSNYTYLLNNAGQYVRRWKATGEPGRSAYLLENGHMIRASAVTTGGPSTGGGEGGRIEEYDWDGNLVWSFDYVSPTYIAHHDFKVLPNGNVLILAAEKKSTAEVLAVGFNPALLDASITATNGYMLPDYVIEVKPTLPSGGTIVWEWHLWDHIIQHFSATAKNYGVLAEHPELIDVNGPGIKIPQFWNHVNGIDYHAQFDQIMISVRANNEVFILDHGTTTAQAASHSGGRYGKGGDILYRWGDPQQYNRGTAANRILYQQHHTHWIEAGLPGAGNILIYNNGIGRNYSTVEEILPPVDATGNYALATGAAYGPSASLWTYKSTPPTAFYSSEISGAQRLPNGNTLICEGIKGNLFEVTPTGETVWRYVCPVTTTPLAQGSAIPVDPGRSDQFMNAVFRVDRYAPTYPGLAGRDLTPIATIETY